MGQEPNGIDEGRTASDGSAEGGDPEETVRRLEDRAQAIRGNLDVLVDEVERRGSRVVRPMVLGTGPPRSWCWWSVAPPSGEVSGAAHDRRGCVG